MVDMEANFYSEISELIEPANGVKLQQCSICRRNLKKPIRCTHGHLFCRGCVDQNKFIPAEEAAALAAVAATESLVGSGTASSMERRKELRRVLTQQQAALEAARPATRVVLTFAPERSAGVGGSISEGSIVRSARSATNMNQSAAWSSKFDQHGHPDGADWKRVAATGGRSSDGWTLEEQEGEMNNEQLLTHMSAVQGLMDDVRRDVELAKNLSCQADREAHSMNDATALMVAAAQNVSSVNGQLFDRGMALLKDLSSHVLDLAGDVREATSFTAAKTGEMLRRIKRLVERASYAKQMIARSSAQVQEHASTAVQRVSLGALLLQVETAKVKDDLKKIDESIEAVIKAVDELDVQVKQVAVLQDRTSVLVLESVPQAIMELQIEVNLLSNRCNCAVVNARLAASCADDLSRVLRQNIPLMPAIVTHTLVKYAALVERQTYPIVYPSRLPRSPATTRVDARRPARGKSAGQLSEPCAWK